MIDTTDLTSYYPGYDEYYEPKEESQEDISWQYMDEYYKDTMIRKETKRMERDVINLNNTNMTYDEIMQLKDYIWKNDKLIPIELIDGE